MSGAWHAGLCCARGMNQKLQWGDTILLISAVFSESFWKILEEFSSLLEDFWKILDPF